MTDDVAWECSLIIAEDRVNYSRIPLAAMHAELAMLGVDDPLLERLVAAGDELQKLADEINDYRKTEPWETRMTEEKGVSMDVVRKAYQPLNIMQMVAPPVVKQTPKEMFATILSAYTTADAGMIWEDMVHAGLIVQ